MSESEDKLRDKLRQALASFQAGDMEGAARACGEVLEQSPRHPDALHLLGLVYTSSHRLAEAIEALGRRGHGDAARVFRRGGLFQGPGRSAGNPRGMRSGHHDQQCDGASGRRARQAHLAPLSRRPRAVPLLAHGGSYRSLWYPAVEIVTAPQLEEWAPLIEHTAAKLAAELNR